MAVGRAFAALIPELLVLAGAAFVVWAAWATSPRLGQLAAGVMLIYAGRQLARTEKVGRKDG